MSRNCISVGYVSDLHNPLLGVPTCYVKSNVTSDQRYNFCRAAYLLFPDNAHALLQGMKMGYGHSSQDAYKNLKRTLRDLCSEVLCQLLY